MPINNVCFSGNLVADPRKAGKVDAPILGFTIAVNCPRYVNKEWIDEPMYLDCSIFGNRAKSLGSILTKGMGVTVQGRLVPNNYDKDGQTIYKQQIIVNEIQLPKKETGNDNW